MSLNKKYLSNHQRNNELNRKKSYNLIINNLIKVGKK